MCLWSFGLIVVCSFGRVFGRSFGYFAVWLFVRLVLCSCGRLFLWSFGLLVVCSCSRVTVWSFYSLGLLVVSSCVSLFHLLFLFCFCFCFLLVFLEDRFPEAVYFYGISQDSKFTLRLLQLTEKEGLNTRNENGKASMQRLAENIANLDAEVILLFTTEEKFQLLMTETVC